MITEDLLKRPGLWVSRGRKKGIIISSRVRLARNLKTHLFPGRADEPERITICREMHRALQQVPVLSDALYVDMGKLDDVDCEVLKERHLISAELAEQGVGSALMVARDERMAVMINEEDHLRLQAIAPGLDLDTVWEKLCAVDSALEDLVPVAFSRDLGYLTACPSNVGTGLRASVMMHLSGLRLTNDIEAVAKGLEKMGLAVRGSLGEGTDAYGNMFQISNQSTLGETEEEVIRNLEAVVSEVAMHERNARERLLSGRRSYLVDQVGRAFGVLMYARLLSSHEALDLLSGIRLGVEMDLVHGLTLDQINEIMLATQPGHLQKQSHRLIEPEDRDAARAAMIRERLADVSVEG